MRAYGEIPKILLSTKPIEKNNKDSVFPPIFPVIGIQSKRSSTTPMINNGLPNRPMIKKWVTLI